MKPPGSRTAPPTPAHAGRFLPIAVAFLVSAATAARAAEAPGDTPAGGWLSQAPRDTIASAPATPPPVAPPLPLAPARRGPGALLREDRLEHASLAFALGMGAGMLSRAPSAGGGVAITLGLAKEIADDHFDRGDFAADVIGASLAMWVVAALTR